MGQLGDSREAVPYRCRCARPAVDRCKPAEPDVPPNHEPTGRFRLPDLGIGRARREAAGKGVAPVAESETSFGVQNVDNASANKFRECGS